MKRNLVSLFAALALVISQSSKFMEARGEVRYSPVAQSKDFKKAVDFEPGGDLTLKTDKGSVNVTSWDQNRIEISARIDPPENVGADYGRQSVEGARIDVTGGGRSLTVRSNFDGVPYKDGFGNHSKTLPDIHYSIRAPRNLNLGLDIDRSKVSLQGFKGKIRIETDRTPVTATDLAGEIHIRMDRGEAKLSGIRGSLDIETDRTNTRLRAVHIDGDSQVDIDRGELELGLAESQGLTVSANRSRRGSFESDFELASNTSKERSIEGSINGGGPKLSIRTDRGKVSLKRD
jgi:hypothetical protein